MPGQALLGDAARMSPELLRAFQPFVRAHPRVLSWAAGRCSPLQLPENRWLVRSGRALPGCFYLLRGRLRLISAAGKDQVVSAHSGRARWPVYPGPAAVRTLAPVRLLRLDADPAWLETIAQTDSPCPADGPGALPAPGLPDELAEGGLPEVDGDTGFWEHAFLVSPLMQRLAPDAWQRILRAMAWVGCGAGEQVLHQGAPGHGCYVLAAGRAAVLRNGQVLATLRPGDIFGEEALITGAGRNASVVMVEAGALRYLPEEAFRELLLVQVVRSAVEPGGRVRLDISATRSAGVLWLPLETLRNRAGALDDRLAYAVQGGTAAQRALAVFLLAQRGIDAVPLGG